MTPMQPYRYHPGPVPGSVPGGRASGGLPLGLGVGGACVAALAFLVAGVMTIVIHRDGSERSPDDALITVLVVLTSVVTGLLLLFGLGLILVGHDAGRSGIVWTGVAALPWALLVAVEIASSADELFIKVAGFACGVAALLGLVLAMISLGIPPGRRWLATRVLARAEPAGPSMSPWPSMPPAPLVGARRRFVGSAVLGIAGGAALLVLTPFATESSDGSVPAMITWTIVLVLFVAVPQAFGLWGVRLVLRGRRSGANVARAGGVFAVYGLEIFVVLGVFDAMAGIQYDDTVLPGPVTIPLAVVFTCVVVLGLVQYVAGLAGLADPRTERFLRSAGAQRVH